MEEEVRVGVGQHGERVRVVLEVANVLRDRQHPRAGGAEPPVQVLDERAGDRIRDERPHLIQDDERAGDTNGAAHVPPDEVSQDQDHHRHELGVAL